MDNVASPSAIPSSPKPAFTIRTMQSDISSLKQTGGVASVEQAVSIAAGPERSSVGEGAGQSIFQQGGLLSEEQLYQTYKATNVPREGGGIIKKLLIALFVMALAGGLGFLVYAIASRVFAR